MKTLIVAGSMALLLTLSGCYVPAPAPAPVAYNPPPPPPPGYYPPAYYAPAPVYAAPVSVGIGFGGGGWRR